MPTDDRILNGIHFGRIRLHVYQGGAFKGIQTSHPEKSTIALKEFDHAEAYRVGTVRGARCKDSMDLGSPRRSGLKDLSIGPILQIEHYDVRALLDMEEGWIVLLEYLQCALIPCIPSLERGLLLFLIG